MPYEVVKRGEEYCVIVEESGETLGCHPTRAEAIAQMQAVAISESKILGPKAIESLIDIILKDSEDEQ